MNERLAGLYQQLGLMSDAMGQLQQVAAGCERTGDLVRLAAVLRQMVELDPDNVASTVKLGELHARGGEIPAALECFRRAGALLKRQGRTDEYLKVAERIAAVQPGDLPITRELAHLYLARGDTKRALAKLQLCFKGDPDDVETLHLLAQAFRDLGQHGKMVSVYKELAHVHGEHGRQAEARATWQKVADLAPGDEDAEAALAAPPAAAPPPVAPPPVAPPPVAKAQVAKTQVATRPPLQRVPRQPRRRPPRPRPRSRRRARPPIRSRSSSPRPTSTPSTGCATARCSTSARSWSSIPARPRRTSALRDLHASAGRPDEAARAGVAAVRALHVRGELERAGRALERLRELAPDHPEVAALSGAVERSHEVELEPVEVDEVDEVAPVDVAATGPADEPGRARDRGGRPRHRGWAWRTRPWSSRWSTPSRRPSSRSMLPAPPPGRLPAAGALATGRAAPATPPAAVAGTGGDEAQDLSDDFEVADFFLEQGLVDEARDALRALLAAHPGHRVVRRARLEALEREAGRASRRRGRPRRTRRFDLAREIADDLGDAPRHLGGVPVLRRGRVRPVQEGRRADGPAGGQRHPLRPRHRLPGDGPARRRGARVRDGAPRGGPPPGRRLPQHGGAVPHGEGRFRAGRSRPSGGRSRRRTSTREAGKALHYELGDAHQAAGERDLALQCFRRVSQLDPAYREVAARLAALGDASRGPRGRTAPSAPEAPAGARRPEEEHRLPVGRFVNYLDFYELSQEPFSNAPVSRLYYASAQHAQALARLTHAVGSMKGLAVLVGDIGAGKTTLARRLLDSLPEDEYEAALLVIVHSGITASWLLRRIARSSGWSTRPTRSSRCCRSSTSGWCASTSRARRPWCSSTRPRCWTPAS